jgi:hypothetical protein
MGHILLVSTRVKSVERRCIIVQKFFDYKERGIKTEKGRMDWLVLTSPLDISAKPHCS